jgi:hypothetical protein
MKATDILLLRLTML